MEPPITTASKPSIPGGSSFPYRLTRVTLCLPPHKFVLEFFCGFFSKTIFGFAKTTNILIFSTPSHFAFQVCCSPSRKIRNRNPMQMGFYFLPVIRKRRQRPIKYSGNFYTSKNLCMRGEILLPSYHIAECKRKNGKDLFSLAPQLF